MNRILLALLATTLATTAFGQTPDNYCGTTDLTAEQEAFLDWFHSEPRSEGQRGAITYIPVKVHIVGTSAGSGYYRKSTLFTVFCELNQHFKDVDFYFYIDGDIHYINNDLFYEHDFNAGEEMMVTNNVSGAVNMYFVGDPAGVCGYYSGGGDAVAISNSCGQPGGTTITHELGHFFSLPHTFRGWEGGAPPSNQRERADGSNCATTADRFCDTPADYVADRWSCPWNGTLTDPVGDTIHPDGTLYMSYANDACTNRFSPQQRLAMRYYLILTRSSLMGNSIAPYTDLDPVQLTSPMNEYWDVPADYALLQWDEVPNATRYHVQVSKSVTFLAPVVDEVVGTNSIVINDLVIYQKYYWRVKPMSEANTCESYSSYWTFTTGLPIGTTEPESFTLSIYPNPTTSGTPLTLDISLSDDAIVRLSDMSGREEWSVVLKQGVHSVQPSAVASGVYVLEVISKTARTTERIMVIP